ncbi:MAG: DUF2892 domain-containing protein [Nitrospirae bacterium]|nr:DUF2892 domain-containing protein [Nitrospirota bacterium]
MKQNIGKIERIARIAVGMALISLAFVGPQTPWAFLGAVPFLTGVLGWCPPYSMLGISTCRSCK